MAFSPIQDTINRRAQLDAQLGGIKDKIQERLANIGKSDDAFMAAGGMQTQQDQSSQAPVQQSGEVQPQAVQPDAVNQVPQGESGGGFTAVQYQEAVKVSGVKTPEAKLSMAENIQSPEIKSAVIKALKTEQAIVNKEKGLSAVESKGSKIPSKKSMDEFVGTPSLFETSAFFKERRAKRRIQKAKEDEFFAQKRHASSLRDIQLQQAKQDLINSRIENESRFGRPAQQAIVETAPGQFTNAKGAVGREVVPGQPAILSERDRVEQQKTLQKTIDATIKKETAVIKAEVKRDKLGSSSKGGDASSKQARIDKLSASILKDLKAANDKLPPDSQELESDLIEQANTRATNANNRGTKVSKNTRDMVSKIFDAADASFEQVSGLNLQRQLLESGQVDTGQFADIRKTVGNVLKSFGIDSSKFGLGDPGQLQLFDSVSYTNLLAVLKEQKGVQTEGDAQRAFNTFAQLGNTKEANLAIIDYMASIAMRKQILSKRVNDFIPSRGLTDSDTKGIRDIVTAFNSNSGFNITATNGGGQLVTMAGFMRNAKQTGVSQQDALEAWVKFTANQ